MKPTDIKTIAEVIALEKPRALAASEAALVQRWDAGFRDEETALRLAFIEWWACVEPDFLTGLENGYGSDITSSKPSHFEAIFDHLIVADVVAPRVLFVLGWMCTTFSYCLGSTTRTWESTGDELLAHFDAGPELPLDAFDTTSVFGGYFRDMLAANKRRNSPVRRPPGRCLGRRSR